MLVKNWMSKPAIVVKADDRLGDAIHLLQKHEIHTLPVMKGACLAGVVTDRDLKNASVPDDRLLKYPKEADRFLNKEISEIMTINPHTVGHNQTIEDAAELLLVHNISGLPVKNQERQVVGVITKNDLFRFILTTIGMGKDGIQIAFEMVDRPECINAITNIIRDYGGRVGTIFSTRERAQRGHRQAFIRIHDIDPPGLARLREVLGKKVKMLYIINHRARMSEIF